MADALVASSIHAFDQLVRLIRWNSMRLVSAIINIKILQRVLLSGKALRNISPEEVPSCHKQLQLSSYLLLSHNTYIYIYNFYVTHAYIYNNPRNVCLSNKHSCKYIFILVNVRDWFVVRLNSCTHTRLIFT